MAEQAEAKEGVFVLTPENADAFYAERLGLEPAQAVESAPESEAEQPQRDEQGKFRPGRASKLTKELTEAQLTAKAKDDEAKAASEELQSAKERLAEIQRERDELRAKYEPPKPDDLGPEPTWESYNGDAQKYATDLKEWTRETALREDQAKRENERITNDWTARLTATRDTIEDFDDVVGKTKAQVPQHIRDEILKSDVGPELLYHLAKHPDEAQKFTAMSVGAGLKAFGRLEAKFESKPETVKVSEVAAPEISRAPTPITPIRAGSSAMDLPLSSKGEWTGSNEQYKAARKAGRI